MGFKNMQGKYYSNCLIEALKAKIRYGKEVELVVIPPWENKRVFPHFMWHDLVDDNIKDFYPQKKKFCVLWFKGSVRCRPYKVYQRWKWDRCW